MKLRAQNHGFCVDVDSLQERAEVTHLNLNDRTVEGLRHTQEPLFSVQYHPESSPGPHDADYLFRRFHRADGAVSRLIPDQQIDTMPKRTDLHSILLIGSGPIVIGQACEFDYSGTQACKALKEEGYRVILVNSNPAHDYDRPRFCGPDLY